MWGYCRRMHCCIRLEELTPCAPIGVGLLLHHRGLAPQLNPCAPKKYLFAFFILCRRHQSPWPPTRSVVVVGVPVSVNSSVRARACPYPEGGTGSPPRGVRQQELEQLVVQQLRSSIQFEIRIFDFSIFFGKTRSPCLIWTASNRRITGE